MRFYPRRVPKDGQGSRLECDHIYSPVLGTNNVPIGQHCPLCDRFNSIEELKGLWAGADAQRSAAQTTPAKKIDHLSVVTHYILTPLLIIVAVILVLEYYGILILPH